MKLKNMTVRGFESASDEVNIDFSDKDMIAFVGENGTGKSMLSIWAPMFALYGKTRQKDLKGIISSTAGKAYIELEFEVSGHIYKVIRNIPRSGKAEASLYEYDADQDAWTALTSDKVTQTNDEIVKIIGMDYKTATSTFVAEQGQYGQFSRSAPAERRRILMQLLKLDQYDKWHETAKEQHTASQNQATVLEGQLDEIDKMYEMVRSSDSPYAEWEQEAIEDRIEELSEVDAEVQRREAELALKQQNKEQELTEARTAVTRFEQVKNEDRARTLDAIRRYDRAELDNRAARLERDLTRIEDSKFVLRDGKRRISILEADVTSAKMDVDDARDERESIKTKGVALKASIENRDAKIAELDEQLSSLPHDWNEDARCTTCQQHISPEILGRVRDELMSEKTREVEARDVDQQEKNKLLKEHAVAEQGMRVAQDALNEVERELTELRQSMTRAETETAKEQQVREDLSSLSEQMADFDKKLKELNTELESIEHRTVPAELTERLQRATQMMEEDGTVETFDYTARHEIAALQKELSRREDTAKKEAGLDQRIVQVQTKLNEVLEDVKHYKVLQKAFSPVGIPAMILAGATTELEEIANEYLAKFSDDELSLNIETQKETQSGSLTENLYVTVNAADGTRSYESFSGGQQFRIDLAIRIAMSKIASQQAGANAVETFFIDEGFGALDEKGKLSTVEALNELAEDVSVIAVSHIDSVKDGFPNLVQTSLETGTTTAEFIRVDGENV